MAWRFASANGVLDLCALVKVAAIVMRCVRVLETHNGRTFVVAQTLMCANDPHWSGEEAVIWHPGMFMQLELRDKISV